MAADTPAAPMTRASLQAAFTEYAKILGRIAMSRTDILADWHEEQAERVIEEALASLAALTASLREREERIERLEKRLREQHKWQCEHDNCMIDGDDHDHDAFFADLTLESSVFRTMDEVNSCIRLFDRLARPTQHDRARYSQATILVARAALAPETAGGTTNG